MRSWCWTSVPWTLCSSDLACAFAGTGLATLRRRIWGWEGRQDPSIWSAATFKAWQLPASPFRARGGSWRLWARAWDRSRPRISFFAVKGWPIVLSSSVLDLTSSCYSSCCLLRVSRGLDARGPRDLWCGHSDLQASHLTSQWSGAASIVSCQSAV